MLTVQQKRVIENNNITVEKVEQGNKATYVFLIAGCFNPQKPKDSEYDAYLAAIDFILTMKADKLINWGELSRILTNSRQGVRKNKVPKKHQKIVSELKNTIETFFSNNLNR